MSRAWPTDAAGRGAALATIQGFLFDCDGVIWRGSHLIDGAAAALEALRASGKPLMFVTNNSTRSRAEVVAKFHGIGLPWVRESQILSSAYVTADFLKSRLRVPLDKKIYVVGESGIVEELHHVGYRHVLGGPQHAHVALDTIPEKFEVDPDVRAVVVGLDRFFNYYKLMYGMLCVLENEDCHFVATNRDARAHLNNSQEWPGGGTMVAALETAIGRSPTVVGKPEPHLFEFACRELGLAKEQAGSICMVGDRLDTDIAFGSRYGMRTILVMTGVTNEKLLRDEGSGEQQPTWVAASLAEVFGV